MPMPASFKARSAYKVDWRRWLREHREILETQLKLLDRGGNLDRGHTGPLFRASAREIVAEWIHELDDLIRSDDTVEASVAPATVGDKRRPRRRQPTPVGRPIPPAA